MKTPALTYFLLVQDSARDCESIRFRTEASIHHEGTKDTKFSIHMSLNNCFSFVISAIAPALLSHKDVVNAENAGAVFCLPPAFMQSFVPSW